MTTSSAATFEAIARQYALGGLDDQQRLEVEERLVVNPEAHETLLLVADELAEDYLDGALNDEDRRNFERHYLATPDHQARLRFLTLLRSQPATATRRPLWTLVPIARHVADSCRQHPQWASAALVALMAWGVVGGWLAVERLRQPARLADLAAAAPPTPRADAPALRGIPVGRDTTEDDRYAGRVAARRAALALDPPDFLLRSGLERGSGTMPRLPIPDEATLVRLRLDVPAVAGVSAYSAAVVDQDGRQVYQVALRHQDPKAGVMAMLVPAEYLPRGDYRVVVTASTAQGAPQTVAAFPFRIMTEMAMERPVTPR